MITYVLSSMVGKEQSKQKCVVLEFLPEDNSVIQVSQEK